MKHIKSYKIFESSTVTGPQPRYPVDYKCLDITTALEEIRTGGLDLCEIPCVESKYGKMDFFRWCGQNLLPIYPNYTLSEDHYKAQVKQFAGTGIPHTRYNYFERDAVYEIPLSYDSSGDLEKWTKKRDDFRKSMTTMAEMSGKKYNPDNEKHVDFGPKTEEWVNIALSKLHELYAQYYVDGKLLIWNSEYEYSDDKAIFDYPVDKSYFLSDLEEWLSDTFDIDTAGFYEWILKCQYIEGRYWETNWIYDFEDVNFRKQKAPENIKQINEILKQIYKVESMDIYIDYYKKVDNKVFA